MKKQIPLESEVQASVCEYLSMKRYFFWRSNNVPMFDKAGGFYRAMGKFSKKGVPDVILIRDGGKVCFLEIKRHGGHLNDAQEVFKADCEAINAEYHVITSLDEIIALGL